MGGADWFALARAGDVDGVQKVLAKKSSFWKSTVRATIKGRLPDVNDAENDTGDTALHIAASTGCVPLIEALLAAEANPSQRNAHGETPMHVAARCNRPDVVRVLAKHGRMLSEDRVTCGGEQYTCLHLAAEHGHGGAVEALLGCGANVDAQTVPGKKTALHIAAAAGKAEIVSSLLVQGASPTDKDGAGRVPKDCAKDDGTRAVFDRQEQAEQQKQKRAAGTSGAPPPSQAPPQPKQPPKVSGPDYYELLKVPRNVSPGTLKKSFRRLAVQYHPDKNPDAKELFQQINNAFKILSNPDTRAVYDAQGADAAEEAVQEGLRQKQTMVQEDLDDIFGDLAKGVGNATVEPTSDDDLLDRVAEQLSGLGGADALKRARTASQEREFDDHETPVVAVKDLDAAMNGLEAELDGIDLNASSLSSAPTSAPAGGQKPQSDRRVSFHPERIFNVDSAPAAAPSATTTDKSPRPPSFHPERIFGLGGDTEPAVSSAPASTTSSARPLSFHPERFFGFDASATAPSPAPAPAASAPPAEPAAISVNDIDKLFSDFVVPEA